MVNAKTDEQRLEEIARWWQDRGYAQHPATELAIEQMDWEDEQYNPDVYIPFAEHAMTGI